MSLVSSLLAIVSSNFRIRNKVSLKQAPDHNHENTQFWPEQCPFDRVVVK